MYESLREFVDTLSNVMNEVSNAASKMFADIVEIASEFFDNLEPYQKFELLHPRKKPRGSIRRRKKTKRSK